MIRAIIPVHLFGLCCEMNEIMNIARKHNLLVIEDVVVRKDLPKLHQLRFDLAPFQRARVFNELAEPLDLIAECDGIDGGDDPFERRLDLHLLVFGQIVEVVRKAVIDLVLPVLLRVGEDPLALVAHTLKAAAHSVDAGGEAALEHRHCEGERAAASAVVLGPLDGLVLDVPGERVVEVVLITIQLE